MTGTSHIQKNSNFTYLLDNISVLCPLWLCDVLLTVTSIDWRKMAGLSFNAHLIIVNHVVLQEVSLVVVFRFHWRSLIHQVIVSAKTGETHEKTEREVHLSVQNHIGSDRLTQNTHQGGKDSRERLSYHNGLSLSRFELVRTINNAEKRTYLEGKSAERPRTPPAIIPSEPKHAIEISPMEMLKNSVWSSLKLMKVSAIVGMNTTTTRRWPHTIRQLFERLKRNLKTEQIQ